MALFTIIVPCYNSSQHIIRCLNSLVNQTYKDIEIIVVDDGSEDNTSAVIEQFIAEGELTNVTLIVKENAGPGSARNLGLLKARGEYISFVDSDDYLHLETINFCWHKLHQLCLDAIFFESYVQESDFEQVRNQKFKNGRSPRVINTILAGEEIFSISVSEDKYIESPVLYVVKRNCLRGITFPEGTLYEDSVFTTKMLLSGRLKRVFSTAERFYYRVARNGSITGRPEEEKNLISYVAVYSELTHLMRKEKNQRNYQSIDMYRSIFLRSAIKLNLTLGSNVPWKLIFYIAITKRLHKDVKKKLIFHWFVKKFS